MRQHEIQIRVRYSETDAMGFLHHANYFSYFEVGRTELFRAQGGDYRAMEEGGLFLVVAKLDNRLLAPETTPSARSRSKKRNSRDAETPSHRFPSIAPEFEFRAVAFNRLNQSGDSQRLVFQ